MLTGSCLCGAVNYQLDENIDSFVFCHCRRCRKATGSAFNTAALIQAKNFTLKQGKDKLKAFSYQGVDRYFCLDCGSPIFSSRSCEPAVYRLRLGTLDNTLHIRNKVHIFVASKANWDDINDQYPQFAELPN